MNSFAPIALAFLATLVVTEANPLVDRCKAGDLANTNPQLEEVGGSRLECIFKDRGDGRGWFGSAENATIIPQGLLTYVAPPNEVFQLEFSEVSPGVQAYVMKAAFVPQLVGGIAFLDASDSKTPEGLPTFVAILICKDQQPAATFVKFFGVPSPADIQVLNDVYGVPASDDVIKPCLAAASPY